MRAIPHKLSLSLPFNQVRCYQSELSWYLLTTCLRLHILPCALSSLPHWIIFRQHPFPSLFLSTICFRNRLQIGRGMHEDWWGTGTELLRIYQCCLCKFEWLWHLQVHRRWWQNSQHISVASLCDWLGCFAHCRNQNNRKSMSRLLLIFSQTYLKGYKISINQ